MKLRQSRDRKKGNPSADSGLAGKMRLPQKGREQIGSPMVSGYIKALWPLLTTAASGLDREVRIECKHFFGGAAAYANGCIFMTLTSVGVALKLPEESRAEVTHLGGMPLLYFPKGPLKKDYVIIPDRIATDGDAIAPWIIKSVLFSQAFPKPRYTKRGRVRSQRDGGGR